MIGGRSTKKKAVGEKTCSRFQFDSFWSDNRLKSKPMSAPKNTTTIDSGRYWKPVSSIVWIRRMPSAMTHNTKKMAIELLCSCSTAFDSSVLTTVLLASASFASPSAELSGGTDDDNFKSLLSFGTDVFWLGFGVLDVLVLSLGLAPTNSDAFDTGFGVLDEGKFCPWTTPGSHRTLSIRQLANTINAIDTITWDTEMALNRVDFCVHAMTFDFQHMLRSNRTFSHRNSRLKRLTLNDNWNKRYLLSTFLYENQIKLLFVRFFYDFITLHAKMPSFFARRYEYVCKWFVEWKSEKKTIITIEMSKTWHSELCVSCVAGSVLWLRSMLAKKTHSVANIWLLARFSWI